MSRYTRVLLVSVTGCALAIAPVTAEAIGLIGGGTVTSASTNYCC